MPGQPTAYELARQRLAQRRASQPPRRSFMDSISDTIGGVTDAVLPSKTLSDYWEGPLYALQHPVESAKLVGQGMYDAQAEQFRKAQKAPTLSEKIAYNAAGALPFLGPMAAGAGEQIGQGNFARGGGQAVGILGSLYAGSKAKGKAPIPEPVVEAPKPRGPLALLPERTGPRFYAGEAGVADATQKYPTHVGNPNPYIESGTPTLADVGEVVNMPPELVAAGYGPVRAPMPSVGKQMTRQAQQVRSAMLGEKARQPKMGAPLTARQSIDVAAQKVGMPGFSDRGPARTPPGVPSVEKVTAQQPRQGYYPAEDPNVMGIGDVAPVAQEGPMKAPLPAGHQSALRKLGIPEENIRSMSIEQADKVLKKLGVAGSKPKAQNARLSQKTNRVGEKVPDIKDTPLKPAFEQVSQDLKSGTEVQRPYRMLSDKDLETLGIQGDAQAIKEAIGRRRGEYKQFVPGDVDAPRPTQPRPSLGDRLRDERGMIDLTGEKGIPDKPGTVRLYRGESEGSRPGKLAGQTFTDDPLAAVFYAKQNGGAGRTYYIDLPAEEAAKYRTADATGQGVHILPPELADSARSNVLGAGAEGQSVIKPKFSAGETGAVGPGVGDLNSGRAATKIDFNAPLGGQPRGNIFHRTVNKVFDTNFGNWVNARRATAIEGIIKRREFADLDSKGMQGIHDFQAGLQSGRFADVKKYFDDKHKQLSEVGVKLGFRENYLPQLWENSADDVFKVQKRLGLQPSFTLDRVLENYQKGIAEGLTPKYKTIGELMGWYESRANKAIADRQFFDHLRETRQILPEGKAPSDWVTINPDNFPVQKFITKKQEHYTKNYKAPAPVARAINNYLGEGADFAKWIGDKASLTKNIILSSGIPLTGFNAHGFNIAARNVMAKGILKGGPEALKYIINPKSAKTWFGDNIHLAPDAVKHGLTLTTEEHLIGETGSVHLLKEPKTKVGKVMNKGFNKVLEAHGKLFEDPLFQNILPALKLKHWKGLVDDLVKGGMDVTEAKKSAADTTNALYGGINWEAMQRSRDLQNLMRGIVLAPDWFESQYRIGKGMAKTVQQASKGDAFDPRGLAYKRIAANLIASYVAADVVNYSLNGQHMWENEPGHALDIKAGSVGGKTRYIRPFGTAADFARLPFDAISGAAQGDLSTTSNILKNRRSTVAKLASNLWMNQDDFGKPIFGEDQYGRKQSIPVQLGKAGREVADIATPQYLSGGIGYATGRISSPEEAILGSVEAPVRYSRESTKRHSRYRSQRRRPSRSR